MCGAVDNRRPAATAAEEVPMQKLWPLRGLKGDGYNEWHPKESLQLPTVNLERHRPDWNENEGPLGVQGKEGQTHDRHCGEW